jgi:hypothetical protein
MHGKGFTSLVRSASFRTDVKEVVARFAGETNRLPLIPLLAGFDEVVHPLDTGLGPSVLELPLLSLGAHIAVARFQLLFLAVQDQRGLPLERRADHGDRHAHRADRRPRCTVSSTIRTFSKPGTFEGYSPRFLRTTPGAISRLSPTAWAVSSMGHRTMLLIVRHATGQDKHRRDEPGHGRAPLASDGNVSVTWACHQVGFPPHSCQGSVGEA